MNESYCVELVIIRHDRFLHKRPTASEGDAADVEYNYNEMTRGFRVKEV